MLSELRCLRSALGFRKLYSRHQTRILTYLGLPGRGSNPGLYITRETLQLQSWYGRFYQDKECPRWRSSCSMHAMLCFTTEEYCLWKKLTSRWPHRGQCRSKAGETLIPDGQYKTLYTWKKRSVRGQTDANAKASLHKITIMESLIHLGKKKWTRLNRCECKGNFT